MPRGGSSTFKTEVAIDSGVMRVETAHPEELVPVCDVGWDMDFYSVAVPACATAGNRVASLQALRASAPRPAQNGQRYPARSPPRPHSGVSARQLARGTAVNL